MQAILSNPTKGLIFRDAARPIAEKFLGVTLLPEIVLNIGKPPRPHSFDLVSQDRGWVIECKNLAWRENGGVPEAKITSVTEAATILQALALDCHKAIVMNRARHPKRIESLADYYFRLHGHLLGSVFLAEIDIATQTMRWLSEPPS